MCKSCAARQITAECAHCGVVKQVVARDAAGQRICEPCHGRDRGGRRCGVCGQTALITVRARGGTPDICVSCYRMPSAVCGKYRKCNFAGLTTAAVVTAMFVPGAWSFHAMVAGIGGIR
jgi:hypothetical protein